MTPPRPPMPTRVGLHSSSEPAQRISPNSSVPMRPSGTESFAPWAATRQHRGSTSPSAEQLTGS